MPKKNERNPALIFTCIYGDDRPAVYIGNAGVANSEDSNSNDTISDGKTTDEITRVDIVGDESNVSKYPDILFSDFIASLLQVHRYR